MHSSLRELAMKYSWVLRLPPGLLSKEASDGLGMYSTVQIAQANLVGIGAVEG